MAEQSPIDLMYAQVRTSEDTETRIRVFERYGYPLPDLDNYDILPGNDPVFESGWHRWFFLFQLTTGIERASIMAIAFELHRSCPSPHMHNVGFFSHTFSDSSRDMYYAKAMCLAYRSMLADNDVEVELL